MYGSLNMVQIRLFTTTQCFFDGNYHHQDVLIGKEIGELWETEVTKNKGIYWNCNARKNDFRKYDRIATGMIHHKDKRQRENLELMAEYLIKPDYFVKTALSEGARTFGKGENQQNLNQEDQENRVNFRYTLSKKINF